MGNVVETFNLTKYFKDWWGRNKVIAVDGLSLEIKENEVFGLLGPNGSGKTTTIKLLLGLLHPTKGHSFIFGGDSTDPKINKRIGFLPEESYLYKYLTARETLDFYGRLFSLPRDVRKTRTEELLDMVGLKAVANRTVGTFSKGMARRIGLAQALINDPDLLILDEPTTGLDPIGTRQIKDLIIALAKRGKTILLCSHLLADVEDVCDRISILYGGTVQKQGNVKDLLEKTNKIQIVSDNIDDHAIKQIEEIIKAQNASYSIEKPMEKLETFFVKTISQAKQQNLTTSGSDSSTKIGNFLAAEKAEPDILAELSADEVVDKKQEKKKVVETKQTQASKVGDSLLHDLTADSTPVLSKPEQQEPDKKEKNESEKQIDTSILDLLTGDSETKAADTDQTEHRETDNA